MVNSRTEAAAAIVVGFVVAGSYVWFGYPALLLVGAFLAGIGTMGLVQALRRNRRYAGQEVMVRGLWATCRRWPSGIVLRDPDTGCGVAVERERGFLTLAITGDPDQTPAGQTVTVTRYLLGWGAAPVLPPLFRHTALLNDPSPTRMGWRQRAGLLRFNEQTGAMEASLEELVELRTQLDRTIAAAAEGQS